MRLHLNPKWLPGVSLTVVKAGDVLTINGDEFDFSTLPDGALLPGGSVPCSVIDGPVERVDGQLRLTLQLPYTSASPGQHVAFPATLTDPPDGPVDLPFEDISTVQEVRVAGGVEVVTTTRRWQQSDLVSTVFLADPPQIEQKENADGRLDA